MSRAKELLERFGRLGESDNRAPVVHREVLFKGKEPSVFTGNGWRAPTFTLEVYKMRTKDNVAGKSDTYNFKAEIIYDKGYPDNSGITDVLNKGRIDTPFVRVESKEKAIKLAKDEFKKIRKEYRV